MCVLDQDDHTLIWNRAFLRVFPEHAERIHEGEHFRDKLRRFSQVRLTGELGSIDRYIEEGVARNQAQQQPFKRRGGALLLNAVAECFIGDAFHVRSHTDLCR